MILRTVHLPPLYDAPSESSESARLHYGAVLRALRDVELNGVVLVDADGEILAEFLDRISRWPQEYRARALTLIGELQKRHRFVKLERAADVPVDECLASSCRHALAIASVSKPDAIIAPSSCACRSACNSNSISVRDYEFSPFVRKVQRSQRYQLADEDWTKESFKNQILIPLFRHAGHVNVFDRYVGRRYLSDLRKSRQSVQQSRSSFQDTLEWIFKLYVRTSGRKPLGPFEVFSSLDADATPQAQRIATTGLQAFAQEMSNTHGSSFTIFLKVDTRRQQMPHARYIFTDQLHVLVERGFDLLSRGRIRDVVLARVDGPGKVEEAIRRLPDAS